MHTKTLSLDIEAIYKPPTADTGKFLKVYNEQLSKRQQILVFGDFNLDLLSHDNPVKEYKEVLQENNIRILNKINKIHCTRETTTTATILDHVCSSLIENTFKMTVIESNMSDHKQIYLEIN